MRACVRACVRAYNIYTVVARLEWQLIILLFDYPWILLPSIVYNSEVWINLWVGILQVIFTGGCLQVAFSLVRQRLICPKAKKNSGSQGKEQGKKDFEMSMPYSCRICCTKMVTNYKTNYKIMFFFTGPSNFTLLSKRIVVVSNCRRFCVAIICTIFNSWVLFVRGGGANGPNINNNAANLIIIFTKMLDHTGL